MSEVKVKPNAEDQEEPRFATWRYLVHLGRFRPWFFLASVFFTTMVFAVSSQITGLIIRAFFDSLTGSAPVRFGPWALSALVVGTALARVGFIFGDIAVHVTNRFTLGALLRRNLFERILDRPGARAVPGSPGEAISRFRGDVDEFAGFICEMPFPISFGAFAVVAVVVMLGINTRITLIVFLPLALVTVLANLAVKRMEYYCRASRKATGRVTAFIGEMFGAAQAVKVATA